VAPEALKKPSYTAFPAERLVPFLRGVADPAGAGLSEDEERNLRAFEGSVNAWLTRQREG
jgi:hypothetical protein